jgi:hypothetical protein
VYVSSYDNSLYAFALPPPEASIFAPPPNGSPGCTASPAGQTGTIL